MKYMYNLFQLNETFFIEILFYRLRTSVLVLTFLTYTCYHASRKPLSVVKSYFGRKCDGLIPPPGTNINDTKWCDWAPFCE